MPELWHYGPHLFSQMHVQLCSHLAAQQCQVCPSPRSQTARHSPCSNQKVMSATPTSYSRSWHQWLCNRWTGTHKNGELKQDLCCMNSNVATCSQLIRIFFRRPRVLGRQPTRSCCACTIECRTKDGNHTKAPKSSLLKCQR